MAFIQLTNYGQKKYPILFNVEYIEMIEPKYLNWKHSITRIHYQGCFHDVSESYAQVTKLIEGVSVIGGMNVVKEMYIKGKTTNGD